MIKNLDDDEFLFVHLLCGDESTLIHKERFCPSTRHEISKMICIQNAIRSCLFATLPDVSFGSSRQCDLGRNVFYAYAWTHADGEVFVCVFNDEASALSDRNDRLNENR